jgi:hypothetical protein
MFAKKFYTKLRQLFMAQWSSGAAFIKKNTQLPVAPVSVHQWELQVVKNLFSFF